MEIALQIDKLTPCLIERATGKIFNTVFKLTTNSDVKSLQSKGWLFDWSNLEVEDANIYKLTLENGEDIQGLIATKVTTGSVYVALVESAPHNLGANKKYVGVGGHLFAIAIKLSLKNDFGGFIHFDTKNMELVEHYTKLLGAKHIGGFHEYRMIVDVDEAKIVMDKYTLEGDLE